MNEQRFKGRKDVRLGSEKQNGPVAITVPVSSGLLGKRVAEDLWWASETCILG